jgi:DNA-binding transcriptional LysR family regulator
MNDWDLRIFETVARLGGIGRAAVELNTVQSNVTTRMRHLEEELGVPLLDRHSRGVMLTAAGQRLQPYAVQILDLFDDAYRAVRDDGAPQGPLALGTLETTAALRLPSVLTAFAKAYPAVDLRLTTGTTFSLTEAVLTRHLDGAFVVGPVHHPELVSATMFREKLVLVTSPSIKTISRLNDVTDLKIVVFRAGCSYRQTLEAWLAKRGIVGLRILEFGSLDAIIGCVGAGIGITMLPTGTVEAALRAGLVATHALPPADARAETMFIRRRDRVASSALTAFMKMAGPATVHAIAAE